MRRHAYLGVAVVLCLAGAVAAQQSMAKPEWAMNATIIEACSCPMFCQCYFNDSPAEHTGHGAHAGHGTGHFCRFNNAFRVNKGHAGATSLDGAKFWIAGDLGADFSDGEMDWAVLHFDPSVTPAQREGIVKVLTHLYPVKWKSFTVGADLPMEWQAGQDRSVARLDGGKAAEVVLNRPKVGNTDEPIVMKNLKYWGAPKNDGFVMMPNEVEAYRLGEKAFEFKGTNGFMITLDIDSNTAPPAPSAAAD
ncbi:MAG TPA: DUF1326 domain-containing protein [Vicinamibacterales bacterium]|nr:DUF1326 domain-containing protein [Vicinamibacterales bacterium]